MPIRTNVDFAAEDASSSMQTVNVSDPFAAEATKNASPAGVNPTQTTVPSSDDENNIDIDGLFDDNDTLKDGETVDGQPKAGEQQDDKQPKKPVTEQDYLNAVSSYAGSVVEGLFKSADLAKQFESGDAKAVVSGLQSIMAEMYKTVIRDASQLASYFSDAGYNRLSKEQAEKEQRSSRQSVLDKAIADYPALSSPQYRHIVNSVFQTALDKGKKPAEAAKMVVAYFKKNIPNAIQPATQTKQTGSSSINDDIWASYR